MQRFYSLIVIFLALGLSNNYAFSQSAENQNPVNPASPTSRLEGSKSKGIGHSKLVVTALSQRGSDNGINHLIDVLPLFALTNDSIIQPIDLSADYTGMPLIAWKVMISKDSLTLGIKHV